MVTTEHEGRGKSTFVPSHDQDYVLHVLRPSGNYRVNYYIENSRNYQ